MKDIQQLIKQSSHEGTYEKVFPKTFLDAVKDKKTGLSLTDILSGFNMYFLSYTGSVESTRLQVPPYLRKTGLWVTYVKYDKTVITEWYAGEDVSDEAWKLDSNWRIGSNMLIGDISISSEGNWVVNGTDTGVRAVGEKGITPLLRINDNKLQVSYTEGSSYTNINDTPVYTKFRESENKLQQSTDLGNTWTDISDYIAAWFRWKSDGRGGRDKIGKIQISRDGGNTWLDFSDDFYNGLYIKDYVSTVGELPSHALLGDIYGVGPTYASEDTEHTNPIYRLYVRTSSGWVDNGQFTSISAGVTQEITDSEFTVPSNSAIRNKLCLQELGDSTQFPISQAVVTKHLECTGSVDITYLNIDERSLNINFSKGIVEFAGGRLVATLNRVPYTAIEITLPAGNTEFLVRAGYTIDKSVLWILFLDIEDKKLYLANYSYTDIHTIYDDNGNLRYLFLGLVHTIGGKWHYTGSLPLMIDGVVYSSQPRVSNQAYNYALINRIDKNSFIDIDFNEKKIHINGTVFINLFNGENTRFKQLTEENNGNTNIIGESNYSNIVVIYNIITDKIEGYTIVDAKLPLNREDYYIIGVVFYGENKNNEKYNWSLDPIDGPNAFILGINGIQKDLTISMRDTQIYLSSAITYKDSYTFILPDEICIYNTNKLDVRIFFDKTEDSPEWTNTYRDRHFLKSQREVDIRDYFDKIIPYLLYSIYITESNEQDDYSKLPILIRPSMNTFKDTFPLDSYGYTKHILNWRYGKFINKEWFDTPKFSSNSLVPANGYSFIGSGCPLTIDINNLKVIAKEGRIVTIYNGLIEDNIKFAEHETNFVGNFIAEHINFVCFDRDEKKFYLVTYVEWPTFITNHNVTLLAFGSMKKEGMEAFTTLGPIIIWGKLYQPSAVNMPFVSSSTSDTTFYEKSDVGNLEYQEVSDTDYAQIILYGQSLSMGWECPEAITTDSVDGNFMVGDSPLINHGNNHDETLHPLISIKWNNGGEQPIIGCVNSFSKLYRRFVRKEQLFIGSSAGEGGQSIERLSKGCTNTGGNIIDNNYYHTEFLRLLNQTKSAVTKESKTVGVPAILYMQGEHNYTGSGLGMTPGTEATRDKDEYKALLLQLKNDMQADIMKIYGQTKKPLFFIYEVAGYYINRRDMSLNMAQIEFALENDDVFLLNPTYATPDYHGGHLSTNGYRWYGEQMAKSLYNVLVKGVMFKTPVFPKKFMVNGNQLHIDFYAPVLPLVFDTWTKEQITDMGFRVFKDNSEVSITDIKIVSNQVLLTCSSDLTGTIEVTYAGEGRNGSGNLRDSDAFHSLYTYYDDRETSPDKRENYTPIDKEGNYIYGKPYPMYNWCGNFYYKIIK